MGFFKRRQNKRDMKGLADTLRDKGLSYNWEAIKALQDQVHALERILEAAGIAVWHDAEWVVLRGKDPATRIPGPRPRPSITSPYRPPEDGMSEGIGQ